MILLRSLLKRYPEDVCVRPDSFGVTRRTRAQENTSASLRLAIQSVSDKFYFLLFGAISMSLTSHTRVWTDLVVVRSVNGAVGVGLLPELKRGLVVAWIKSKPWERAYKGVADGIAYRCTTWAHPFLDLRDWIKSKSLWLELQQSAQLSLKIGHIEVADLLVDSYLRFKPAPEFDVKDPFVRRLVWQALRNVRLAQDYFGRIRPHLYLTSYSTYLEHGIPARVAVHNGVEVWAFGSLNCFGKRLKWDDTYAPPDFSDYRKVFDSLEGKDNLLEAARQQLVKRLSGGVDAATSYMRQSAYAVSDIDVPDGLTGAVVVFLHDFYDSPHVYPDLVFDDFWQWICFTIEVLRRSGIRFFLKPHPNQIALSDEALSHLRRNYPDLQWLPAGVSNVQLARAGIACGVTVYGTVAHELAYLGVPSIGCARHPHHSFEFCRTARTRDAYEGMLKSYKMMPAPLGEMQRQALAFYYMHNLYGDDDQRALRQAFVAFWKACNVGQVSEENVICSFQALIELPAFDRFIKNLVHDQNKVNAIEDSEVDFK